METGPIYIGGLDRCGKTMMQAFLTSHPRIAIPDVGSNMWTYFYGRYGDLARRENFERCLDALLHYTHVLHLQPDPVRIRREFEQGPTTYAHLFALFLMHFAERQGKPRWGAQTGMIECYADHLFAAYPGLKMIHLLRDPRDRYEASLARSPDGKGRAGGAAARWRYTVHLAERNAARYAGRYRIVHYEAMVRDPEAVIRGVCTFLGEEFTPEMLAMHGSPAYREKIGAGSDSCSGAISLSPDFIGRYRHGIDPEEIACIQRLGGRQMRANGYDLDPIRLAWGKRIRFAAVTLPLNVLRMVAWRLFAELHLRFPRRFGRQPSAKTIIHAADRPPEGAGHKHRRLTEVP